MRRLSVNSYNLSFVCRKNPLPVKFDAHLVLFLVYLVVFTLLKIIICDRTRVNIKIKTIHRSKTKKHGYSAILMLSTFDGS